MFVVDSKAWIPEKNLTRKDTAVRQLIHTGGPGVWKRPRFEVCRARAPNVQAA